MGQRGFTLLEVIIAILILSFLSLFTVQSIQRALQTKAKVQGEIDKNATVRDALRTMERDINMAFNYRDINIALYNMAQKQRQKTANTPADKSTTGKGAGATPPPPPLPPQPVDPDKYKLKTEKIYTQFIGEAASLDFTTVSNVRMMENSPISTQAEVGYKLKPCRRRSNQEQSSNCLWRRVDDYFHDDITKDGQETVLLENVTEFKLRYLGPGKTEEWIDTWITSERGDALTKDKFPYAVEITLEIKDPSPKAKDKKLRMTAVAAIRNPNNPENPEQKDANGNPITDPTNGSMPAANQQNIPGG